jgi:hypothetical protein
MLFLEKELKMLRLYSSARLPVSMKINKAGPLLVLPGKSLINF